MRNVIRLLIFAAIVAIIALTIAPPVGVAGDAKGSADVTSTASTSGELQIGDPDQ